MKDLLVLLPHLLTTIAKLLGPGGAKAVVADSLLMKQQFLIMNRARRRARPVKIFMRLPDGNISAAQSLGTGSFPVRHLDTVSQPTPHSTCRP